MRLLCSNDMDLGTTIELQDDLLKEITVLGLLVVCFNVPINELVGQQRLVGWMIDKDFERHLGPGSCQLSKVLREDSHSRFYIILTECWFQLGPGCARQTVGAAESRSRYKRRCVADHH